MRAGTRMVIINASASLVVSLVTTATTLALGLYIKNNHEIPESAKLTAHVNPGVLAEGLQVSITPDKKWSQREGGSMLVSGKHIYYKTFLLKITNQGLLVSRPYSVTIKIHDGSPFLLKFSPLLEAKIPGGDRVISRWDMEKDATSPIFDNGSGTFLFSGPKPEIFTQSCIVLSSPREISDEAISVLVSTDIGAMTCKPNGPFSWESSK